MVDILIVLCFIPIITIVIFVLNRYGNLKSITSFVKAILIISWTLPLIALLLLPIDIASVKLYIL